MKNHYDVVVVGAGPGGALTAMILARRGRRVALIDRDEFPRFAIGESSTPIADRTLEQIAADYDLPELLVLCRWGRWRAARESGEMPGVTGGLKRGFTYFDHRGQGEPAIAVSDSRLMVAASPDDENGDTHWVRAEVDRYLVDVCRVQGVEVRLGCSLESIEGATPWRVRVRPGGEEQIWTCDRMIDASGRAGAVLSRLGYRDAVSSLQTHTSARFTHLWSPEKNDRSGGDDLPYRAFDAAVHHLLSDGWVWELPFSDGRVSVGRVWNRPMCGGGSPARRSQEFAGELDVNGYPAIERWLSDCRLSEIPGRWLEAPRVQHRWAGGSPMSIEMLALPTTMATVDPLHSTGLAHALTGAQRVSDLILRDATEEARGYANQVQAEIELLDRIVSLAYRVWRRTDLVFDAAMLYFAIAIADEELRVQHGFRAGVATWQADAPEVLRVVEEVEVMLIDALRSDSQIVTTGRLSALLRRICQVPLASREDNLYGYTFACEPGSMTT